VSAQPIRELAVKNGMRLMMMDGLIKVTQGVTTVEEILAATQ
jgi:type II secretory ATPase GspE/PulE/Tfp pilus assembly ATPase PilB-like protein